MLDVARHEAAIAHPRCFRIFPALTQALRLPRFRTKGSDGNTMTAALPVREDGVISEP